jgi:drug/metabolite transporter (DMT)-like permease
MALHVCLFIIFGTVGQLFIFYTVKNFGAVVFSIIMSLRILFSALLSCYVYSHSISELGVLGIIIVFGSISYRIHRKMKGQQLIRWKDPSSEDTKGLILKEWHEHIDG